MRLYLLTAALLWLPACDGPAAPCDDPGTRLVGLDYPLTPTSLQQAAALAGPGCAALLSSFSNALFVVSPAPLAYFQGLPGIRAVNDYAITGDTSQIDVFITTPDAPTAADTAYIASLGGVGFPLSSSNTVAALVPLGRLRGLHNHPRFLAFDVSVGASFLSAR